MFVTLLIGVAAIYYNDRYERLYQTPQQLWRAVLLPCTWGTCAVGVKRRMYDGRELGPEFGNLKTWETLVALLSVVSSIVWLVVVRDPERFLRLRRPSSRYRCGVIIVSAATIIPNLALLIQVLVQSLATPPVRGGQLKASVVFSLIHLSFFLGSSCLYLWIVKRFLLDADVTHYEPVVPIRESLPTAPLISPTFADEPQPLPEGHLSRAYDLQWTSHPPYAGELSQLDQSGESGVTETEPTPQTTDTRGPDPSGAAASGPTLHEQASLLRCPTVARFDYIYQARAGPHSWLSDRLLLAAMGTYSTIILALVCIILYEDHFSRFPSP